MEEKMILLGSFEEEKAHVIREETQRIHEEIREKEKDTAQTFLPGKIAREPFLKEILNQRDLWERHDAVIERDETAMGKKSSRYVYCEGKSSWTVPFGRTYGTVHDYLQRVKHQ